MTSLPVDHSQVLSCELPDVPQFTQVLDPTEPADSSSGSQRRCVPPHLLDVLVKVTQCHQIARIDPDAISLFTRSISERSSFTTSTVALSPSAFTHSATARIAA